MGARLLAVVAEGNRERIYLSPTLEQEEATQEAKPTWRPEGEIAARMTGGNCTPYGLTSWGDLFTPRQLVVLTTFSDLAQEARELVKRDAYAAALPDDSKPLCDGGTGAISYAEAVGVYLAFASEQSGRSYMAPSLCVWESQMDRLRGTFGRQALPMVWDYVETNPFAGAGGDIYGTAHSLCEVLDKLFSNIPARAEQQDARGQSLSADRVVSTDPPYYDNIGYATTCLTSSMFGCDAR